MKRRSWTTFNWIVVTSVLFFLFSSNTEAQPKICGNKKADKLLQQGAAEYQKSNYRQAVVFYDRAAEAAPKCPAPFFHKGNALTDEKRFDEAVSAYREALKRNFAEPFRLHYGICYAHLLQQNYQEAINKCEESTRLENRFFWSFYYLSHAYYNSKDFEKALAAAKRAVELDSKSLEARAFKGLILIDLKKYDEGMADLAEVLKINPNESSAMFGLGFAHFTLNNFSKSIEYLEQCVKLRQDLFEAWWILAEAYGQPPQNWAKSEEAALQAIRLRPDDGNALLDLGIAQLAQEKFEAAVRSFDAALKDKDMLAPATAAQRKGYALIGLKKPLEAEKAFEQALTFKPKLKLDHFAISDVYYYRWELDKAQQELRKAINFASDDNDSEEYSTLSWHYSLAGKTQEAIIAINEAIAQNPKDFNAYANSCRAYNESKMPDVAIDVCQKSLALKPDNGEVFFYLARAYALKNDPDQENAYNRKAISAMEKRLGISFRTPTGGTTTPIALPPTGEARAAINTPSHSYFLYLLGNAYFYDKNFEAAVGAYQKVVELRPKFPRLHFNLAVAFLNLRKPNVKSARLEYQILLALDKTLAADLMKIINRSKPAK